LKYHQIMKLISIFGKNIIKIIIIFSLIINIASGIENKYTIILKNYFKSSQYQEQLGNYKVTYDIKLNKKEKSGIKHSLKRSILIYKDLISLQDLEACTFYPSCSEYAFILLNNSSLPKAIFGTGDRILRCYNMNNIYYNQNSEGKNIDFPSFENK